MSERKVWLITGAGRGLGVDIAKAALAAGHAVVATGRDAAKVAAAVGEAVASQASPSASRLRRNASTSSRIESPVTPNRALTRSAMSWLATGMRNIVSQMNVPVSLRP